MPCRSGTHCSHVDRQCKALRAGRVFPWSVSSIADSCKLSSTPISPRIVLVREVRLCTGDTSAKVSARLMDDKQGRVDPSGQARVKRALFIFSIYRPPSPRLAFIVFLKQSKGPRHFAFLQSDTTTLTRSYSYVN